jgi:hypothetical protein
VRAAVVVASRAVVTLVAIVAASVLGGVDALPASIVRRWDDGVSLANLRAARGTVALALETISRVVEDGEQRAAARDEISRLGGELEWALWRHGRDRRWPTGVDTDARRRASRAASSQFERNYGRTSRWDGEEARTMCDALEVVSRTVDAAITACEGQVTPSACDGSP